MIPFSLQVVFYRTLMLVLKFAAWVLPFREPRLFAGPGASRQLCEAIKADGVQRLLIVTDAMLVELGLVKRFTDILDELEVGYTVYDGVKPDPSIEQIEAGVEVLKANDCAAILAIGGGSSIDAAKIIGARATNNKSIEKMEGLFKVFRSPLPLYAVPTTAGTGSEVTVAAVVSNPAEQRKMAIMDLKLVPQMAALDGELMTGLPAPITAATGMDALTHAVEAYISKNALRKTDEKALAATRSIMENLPTAVNDGSNIEARQKMAQAAYDAGVAFTAAGVGYVHAISHNFGARYHTPHGLGNAIVLPYVLDYSKPRCTDRLAELARVSGLAQGGESESELADKFIARIREMNAEFGIPETLKDLRESDIPAITDAALAEAHFTYAVPHYMDKPTCENLVRRMLPG